MKILKTFILTAVLAAGLGLSPVLAQAATPQYSAFINSGSSTISVTVSGADPFSRVDFYARQGSSLGWTVITNIGQTNSSGFFSGTVSPGFADNGQSIQTYVLVNGQPSIVLTLSSGGCFSNCGGTLSASPTSLNISAGTTSTVNFFPSNFQSIYIQQFPNIQTAFVSLSGNTVTVQGRSNGSTTMRVCTTNNFECVNIPITVSGSGSGGLTFSQNNIALLRGQTMTVSAFASGFTVNNLFVSSNSNSFAVSATTSGNTATLFANNLGFSTLNLCATSGNVVFCGDLRVTVTDNSGGQLVFNTTALNAAPLSQFYTAQLQVSGGQTPYFFSINSGALPPGVSLSSSGLISGIPQSLGTYNFSVRVSDNFGRTAFQNLSLNVSGVLGTSFYSNGTLLAEGSTIYIVYRNRKVGFTNFVAFRDLGFKLSNVSIVDSSNIADTGITVSTANAAHPRGSWVVSGGTVYFVHESGLIAVPSWDIFINNGGNGNLIVPANSFDFQLFRLANMTFNDSRLVP